MTETQPAVSSIVLVIDGLRPSMMGPYGNTWFDTPTLNQLAAESLLFEKCISDSSDPVVGQGRSPILRGQHTYDQADTDNDFLIRLRSSDTASVLIRPKAQTPAGDDLRFDRIVDVALPAVEGLATDIGGTQLAHFFSAVVETVASLNQPTFMLVDCPSLMKYWDGMYSLRESLADADDPDPNRDFIAPRFLIDSTNEDPDIVLNLQQAYGGQIQLLDQLLAGLTSELQMTLRGRNSLFCLTSRCGFPLGEHGVVGFPQPSLHAEALHVPLLIRWPDRRATGRSLQLVQPGAIHELLRQWHAIERQPDGGNNAFAEICPERILPLRSEEAVIATCRTGTVSHFAIQTHAWKFIAQPEPKLFVCPDDLWEFNNVAELCPQIVEGLQAVLDQALPHLKQGRAPHFNLADELAWGIE